MVKTAPSGPGTVAVHQCLHFWHLKQKASQYQTCWSEVGGGWGHTSLSGSNTAVIWRPKNLQLFLQPAKLWPCLAKTLRIFEFKTTYLLLCPRQWRSLNVPLTWCVPKTIRVSDTSYEHNGGTKEHWGQITTVCVVPLWKRRTKRERYEDLVEAKKKWGHTLIFSECHWKNVIEIWCWHGGYIADSTEKTHLRTWP